MLNLLIIDRLYFTERLNPLTLNAPYENKKTPN